MKKSIELFSILMIFLGLALVPVGHWGSAASISGATQQGEIDSKVRIVPAKRLQILDRIIRRVFRNFVSYALRQQMELL